MDQKGRKEKGSSLDEPPPPLRINTERRDREPSSFNFDSPTERGKFNAVPSPSSAPTSMNMTSLSALTKYKHSLTAASPSKGSTRKESMFNPEFRMDDQKVEKHIAELEAQLELEKKIMAGAEAICREYAANKRVDRKTLVNAESTLAQSKDKIESLSDEIARFRGMSTSPMSPMLPGRALKRASSTNEFEPEVPLPTSLVSHRIHRLMEKIEIEINVKNGAEKMAKVVGLTAQKGDAKAMEELFESLSNATAKITLMMTALQKYQNMTTSDGGLMSNFPEDSSEDSPFPKDSPRTSLSSSPSNSLNSMLASPASASSAPTSAATTPSTSSSQLKASQIKRQSFTGKIFIKVIAAKGLMKSEVPMNEAYCVIRVDNAVKGKTKAKAKTSKPVWNESFTIQAKGATEIEFEIFDQDSLRGLVFFKFDEIDLTEPLDTWIEAEPQGKLNLQLSCVKSSAPKRKLSQTGRRGAVRKRKIITFEGHRLEPKRLYQITKCAACSEIMLSASCYQCKDCQYICHRRCKENISSKCISEVASTKSILPSYSSPHKWESTIVATPNFCAHCGHMLAIGKKKNLKCSECGIFAHTRCATLFLPDNCNLLRPTSPPTSRKIEKMVKKSASESNVTKPRAQLPEKVKNYYPEDQHPGLQNFTFLNTLGRGNFGKVLLVKEKTTKKLYAMKVLKKEFILENDEIPSIKTEKATFIVTNEAHHPFLIQMHSCFQTETRVYFVMEFVPGGDLMMHIQRVVFTEERAKFYAAEVLLALEFFHNHNIIYRDLKLDNILLGVDGHVKIADYGLCKIVNHINARTNTFCGTPEFMAPEILREQVYGRSVDWWAFGVLLYEMLLAEAPYQGQDEEEIFEAVLTEDLILPDSLNELAADIISKLLIRDPTVRLGCGPGDAKEVKLHPYFTNVDFEKLARLEIEPPYKPFIINETDVGNFDSSFTTQPACVTPIQGSKLQPADQEEFEGFSYTAPWVDDLVHSF